MYVRNKHTHNYYTIGNNIILMRVTCIRPLGHTNIPSTEDGTPKFLMYQMSWGIAGPTCLLESSGPPAEQEPKACYQAEEDEEEEKEEEDEEQEEETSIH